MSARNRFFGVLLVPLLVIVAVVVGASLYIVDEREKALVLRLGRVVHVQEEPGLGFKMPFIDDVVKYDDRILGLPTPQLEITPLDDRRLMVEAFARWRIVDVVQFRQAVSTGGIDAALVRLDPIVRTAVREVLGSVPSTNVLSDDRTALMNRIRDEARANSVGLGIEVIDVRLTRTDLPEGNLNATYDRMRTEREREAADEIARGAEAARRITAAADRTVVELTSEARRNAEITRGEADAERNAIYAEAFGVDPEFFAFSRSMTSYTRALGSNSQLVIQPDGEFFTYLRSDGAEFANPNPTPRPRSEAAPAVPETGEEIGEEAIAPSDYVAPRPLEMPWDAPGGMGPIGGEPSPYLLDEDALPEDGELSDPAPVEGEAAPDAVPAEVAPVEPAPAETVPADPALTPPAPQN